MSYRGFPGLSSWCFPLCDMCIVMVSVCLISKQVMYVLRCWYASTKLEYIWPMNVTLLWDFLFPNIILFRLWFFSVSRGRKSHYLIGQILRLINMFLLLHLGDKGIENWQGAIFICLVWVHEYSYVFIYVWTDYFREKYVNIHSSLLRKKLFLLLV